MKDMLSFLIARDTMHQQQWLAVIEELAACRTGIFGRALECRFAAGRY
jgi:Mn-containing catalase